MPRWQLVLRVMALTLTLSSYGWAQAPGGTTYPFSPTTTPPPGTFGAAPAPVFGAAPPTAVATPQPYDPYSMPSATLSPPGALMPTTPPPATLPAPTLPPAYGTAPPVGVFPAPTRQGAPQARRGWFGGFEGAVLEPKVGVLQIARAVPPVLIPPDEDELFRLVTNATDFDLTFSPRVWGGYMGRQGFGGRVQWWYFDADSKQNTARVEDLRAAMNTHMKFNVFDFEATQMGAFQNWQLEVSGGVRYAQNDQSLSVLLTRGDQASTIGVSQSFEGVGPTIGVMAKRPMGSWEGITFVGKTRYSLLFGDTNVDTSVNDPYFDLPEINLLQSSDSTVTSWELSVGVFWSRILRGGAVLNLGGFLEGQVWNPGNQGLFGPTFHASISR